MKWNETWCVNVFCNHALLKTTKFGDSVISEGSSKSQILRYWMGKWSIWCSKSIETLIQILNEFALAVKNLFDLVIRPTEDTVYNVFIVTYITVFNYHSSVSFPFPIPSLLKDIWNILSVNKISKFRIQEGNISKSRCCRLGHAISERWS